MGRPRLTHFTLAFLGVVHGFIRVASPVNGGLCRRAASAEVSPASERLPRRAASASMQAGGSGPSSEEWREFRRQLISGGIKLTTDESEPNDGGSEAVSERKVIAPGNEALLRSQNAQLYQEYIKGSWAHESPVEAGGLLLRMPLEAQLTHFLRDGAGTDLLGDELRQRLRKEVSALEDGGGEERFDNWLSNTPYCYRLCEGFIAEQLEKLAAQARRGQVTVDAKSMSGSLLRLYQRANQEWQQVVLVFSIGGGGAASGVAINRPLMAEVTPELAKLLLKQTGEAGVLAPKLIEAFGAQTCVYLGGPSDQDSGAVLVHGVHSLDGATELAPGTGIYTGGERAAIEAVRRGAASPLDFRWFIGRHTSLKAGNGGWRGMACARPVALKQCLGLPKPLWHEVMELCGGECATLSRLEILKRDDLPEEDREPA